MVTIVPGASDVYWKDAAFTSVPICASAGGTSAIATAHTSDGARNATSRSNISFPPAPEPYIRESFVASGTLGVVQHHRQCEFSPTALRISKETQVQIISQI